MQFFVFTNTNNENLAIKKLFDLKSNKMDIINDVSFCELQKNSLILAIYRNDYLPRNMISY